MQRNAQEPEFFVYLKAYLLGFVIFGIYQLGTWLGLGLYKGLLAHHPAIWKWGMLGTLLMTALMLAYLYVRGGFRLARRYTQSRRFDLLAFIVLGAVSNELASPLMDVLHKEVDKLPASAGLLILIGGLVIFSSVLTAHLRLNRHAGTAKEIHFLQDNEVSLHEHDQLGMAPKAKDFADAVLACTQHESIVLGVDGPWGVGKTSFINLAAKHWKQPEILVFRFEPLKYAGDADLAQRFVRELIACIQRESYVPELQPFASRYSRLLKGKAEFSLFGLKVELEPGSDTLDELLESLDSTLERVGKKLIVVIDDLDRLEPSAINNVLFGMKKAFRLRRATYILCYDTEMLVALASDGERAREFLEKFVTLKVNVFVDAAALARYLNQDWRKDVPGLDLVPVERMSKLTPLLTKMAEMLQGEHASRYLELMGNFRKIKRIINALLVMQLEKVSYDNTDFNRDDLVNLVLLQQTYPGMFRRIHLEEGGGRSGIFGVVFDNDMSKCKQSQEYLDLIETGPPGSSFLLKQIFGVAGRLVDLNEIDNKKTRAYVNLAGARNLERYIDLILELKVPALTETHIFYKASVQELIAGKTIDEVLDKQEFIHSPGRGVHIQFWGMLAENASRLKGPHIREILEKAIETLSDYNSVSGFSRRSDRDVMISALAKIIDSCFWRAQPQVGAANTSENIIGIAHWFFGEENFSEGPLLKGLIRPSRGVLGWKDLLVFRQQCSLDRGGQLHNISRALLKHSDRAAETSGNVYRLTIEGMRFLSQKIFDDFYASYVKQKKNIFEDIESLTFEQVVGKGFSSSGEDLVDQNALDEFRLSVALYILYQLANRTGPGDSGVGCGFYDRVGASDANGIYKEMSSYILNVCFNPELDVRNTMRFVRFLMWMLRESRGYEEDEIKLDFSWHPLLDMISEPMLRDYWNSNKATILKEVAAYDGMAMRKGHLIIDCQRHWPIVSDYLDKI